MAAAQLRLLRILGGQLVSDAVQQLDVTLLRVLAKRADKGPGHGAGSLAGDLGVLTGLVVLAAGPHDNVGWTGLGLDGALVRLIALGRLLEEPNGRRHHAAHVATRVSRNHTQQALARLLGQVGFLEDTLGRVDVGQVECGTRVTGIEDSRQSDTRLQRFDHDPVHLIVDNVAGSPEIDRVDNFVVSVVFVTVEVRRLSTVSCYCQPQSSKSGL